MLYMLNVSTELHSKPASLAVCSSLLLPGRGQKPLSMVNMRFWLEYRLLFKLFWCETRPCEIHLNTISCKYCFFRFLKSLTKLEKTGYCYFDELLSAITTMFHTYEDRHQVLARQWYVKIFVLLFTKLINLFLVYPVTGNYCQER